MSIDFKDIFRLENCVHKKGFLFGKRSVLGLFLSFARSLRFFSSPPLLFRQKRAGERASGSLLCMFLFIFKAFGIFFNNIFRVWQARRNKEALARERTLVDEKAHPHHRSSCSGGP